MEGYYLSVSSGSTTYYIGLEKAGHLWYLADGTFIGPAVPSNSDPYAHW